MKIPSNVIANADDLGLNETINKAILFCYESGYINSASLLTNTVYFKETVNLIHQNPVISNIGIHVDFAEGKPITQFNQSFFLRDNGNWDLAKTNKKRSHLDTATSLAFADELNAQIEIALAAKIPLTHLDSHYHLHTLPCFYRLFINAAKKYNLKLRLAQTYNEGSLLKFAYRKYINRLFKKNHIERTGRFETVARYLQHGNRGTDGVEIMLHPDINASGKLTDHYDPATMTAWINFLTSS